MRVQPWTEKALMAHEDVFEALTAKAVKQTFKAVRTLLLSGSPLVAAADEIPPAVQTPAPPPQTAPPVSFTALENAVMATWSGYVDSELFPFLTSTFVDSAGRVATGVLEATGRRVEKLTNPYAAEYLQFAHNRMVGIGQALWEKLRGELVEGFQAGEGIREIAARLQQVAALSTPRALATARTEVIGAANGGSYTQMLAAGFDASEVTKVWLATEDTRTRISHRHADNQGVELTGEFQLDIYKGDVKTGEEGLEFPGDPTGTPGNVINCRCSLAFDFSENENENDEEPVTAAGFVEKQHPRDNDGKFKKKGAPDTFEKIKFLVDKIDSLTPAQTVLFLKQIDNESWSKLSKAEKAKVDDKVASISHPETKLQANKVLDALDSGEAQGGLTGKVNVKTAVENLVKKAPAPAAARPQGGKDTKTGKALAPGKPVKLRVQLLYNTTFEDGAVMAVHKDSGERIVWDGKNNKIKRQKLNASGKYETTDTKTRGDAYKAWKDEDGWTVPESTPAPSATPTSTTGGGVGKPTTIKVQLVYQTPFNDGDTVAVNPGTGQRITWDAGKKRMVVHEADGSSKEYTRGALYKEFKDSTGWHLPGEKTATPAPKPAAPKSESEKIVDAAKAHTGANPKKLSEGDGYEVWTVFGGEQIQVAKEDGSDSIELDIDTLTDEKLNDAIAKMTAVSAPVAPKTHGLSKAKISDILNDAVFEENANQVFENDDFEVAASKSYVIINNKKTNADAQLVKSGLTVDKFSKAVNIVLGGDSIKETTKPSAPSPAVAPPPVFIPATKTFGSLPDPDTLKFTGQVVGTHHAKIYIAPNGDKYLFKANPSGFRAAAEVDLATAKLHDAFGFITPDTGITTVDGVKGSLQKLFPDVTSTNPKTFNVKNLTPAEVIDIQKEHIFDWLVANHDAHSDNLLKEKGNPGLIGIDKGQAFKWFGQDKLSTSFNPNEHPQAANVLFEAYAKGAPGVEIKDLGYWEISALLDAIDSMPNKEYKEILRPMAEAMAKDGKLGLQGPAHLGLKKAPFPPNDVEAFLDAAVDRKNALKAQFTKFYADIQAQHDQAVGAGISPITPPAATAKAIPSLPSPGQKAISLGASVLTGKKSTEYKHGQIIATNPSQDARLIWNASAKKYQIQTQTSPGVWATAISYNKSAALKDLKDDPGWYTPVPGQEFIDSSFVPSVSGSPVPTVVAPKLKKAKAPGPLTAQHIADADQRLNQLTASQKTALFDYFKKGGGSTIYLSSDPETLFKKALATQVEFNKSHNTQLNALAVLRHVDAATASKLGVANGNAYEIKVSDWLKTPKGAKKAAELITDAKLTPAEKTAKEAAKKAAAQAKLDVKLKGLKAASISVPETGAPSSAFVTPSVTKMNELQTKMTASAPWTATSKAALTKYTGSYYAQLNNALRGKAPLTDAILKDADNIQKGMRPIPENVKVYRGVLPIAGVLPGTLPEYEALLGKTFEEPAFSSTSIKVGGGFGGGVKLEIEVPKGTPAAWVKNISQHSGEEELLLAAGTKFKIIEAVPSPYGSGILVRVRVVP